MTSHSFNVIGQDEEQELVAFDTRQSRGPTPLSRPNSRMEEMVAQLIKSQEAMVKSLEKISVETNRVLETQISDLVDRRSTVERSLQGRPSTGSDPTRRSLAPPGHAWMASAPYPLWLATPSSRALERSKEEVGFLPLKVQGRPLEKGCVNTTQGQRWGVLEVGETLGQEIILESHSVDPEVQRIQNPVEALSHLERIGVAPGVSAGPAPTSHYNGDEMAINLHFRSVQGQENDKNKMINLGARPKDNMTSSQFLPVGDDPQWEDRRIRPTETQEVRRYQTERLTDEIRVCSSDV